MNHHQRKVLHAIFAHPLNANLEMKDIVSVLNALGAEIDAKSKSRLGVMLNGRTTVLHISSQSVLKAEVMQIRKFLEFLRDCGRGLSDLADTRRSKTRPIHLTMEQLPPSPFTREQSDAAPFLDRPTTCSR